MAIGEAEKLLEQIQKEIGELKKNEDELDKLSHAEDPIHFLQVDKSLFQSQDIGCKVFYCDNMLYNENSPCL